MASGPSKAEERLVYAFITWLLPETHGQRWNDLWRTFKADGSLEWHEFEIFLRHHHMLAPNARKLFDLLDDTGSGRISARTLKEVRRQYERSVDFRHNSVDDLKKILISQHATLARAWFLVFDTGRSGRCCQATFTKMSRQIGFHGDLKKTWGELTKGDVHRVITLADLDAEADAALLRTAAALKKFYSSVREAWFALMRSQGSHGLMHPPQFKAVFEDLGIGEKEAMRIFNYLDVDGRRSLELEEWMLLALWERRCQTQASDDMEALRRPSAKVPDSNGGDGGTTFEFTVVLTREEYNEYLRRRRERSAQEVVGAATMGGGGAWGNDFGGYPESPAATSPRAMSQSGPSLAPDSPWATLTTRAETSVPGAHGGGGTYSSSPLGGLL